MRYQRRISLGKHLKLNVSKSGTKANISWTKVATPDFADTTWLKSYFSTGYGKYATKYFNKRIFYNKNTMGEFGYDIYVKVNGELKKVGFTTNTTYSFNIPTGTTSVVVKTAYNKFKTNQSSGVEKSLESASISMSGNTKQITKGSSITLSPSDIRFSVDGSTINSTDYTVTINNIYDSNNNVVSSSVASSTAGNYTISYTLKYNNQSYLSSDYNANINLTVR